MTSKGNIALIVAAIVGVIFVVGGGVLIKMFPGIIRSMVKKVSIFLRYTVHRDF